jgi:hypothetical protein
MNDWYQAQPLAMDYAQRVATDLCSYAAVNGCAYPIREIQMPAAQLQEQLIALREQLDQNPTLSLEERERVQDLMQQISSEIELERATQERPSMVDSINVAAETFEAEHPTVAGVLRNIAVTLGNIGV